MTPYAKDEMFSVYGFGGIPEYLGHTKVSRLWNLNGKHDPRVKGGMGVLHAYTKAIRGTKMAGPTYFSEALKKIKNDIF